MRAPRVRPLHLEGVRLRIDAPAERSGPRELRNVSSSGVGWVAQAKDEGLARDERVPATLELRDRSFAITLRIAHVTADVVGAAVETPPTGYADALQKFFAVELSATKMNHVRTELLQADSEGVPHWSYGKNRTELFYVEEAGRLVRFQVAFFGNFVEGRAGEAPTLRYGWIEEEESRGSAGVKRVPLVKYSASGTAIPTDVLRGSLSFVENAEGVDPAVREEIRRIILGFLPTG